jgi:hypothetical protein
MVDERRRARSTYWERRTYIYLHNFLGLARKWEDSKGIFKLILKQTVA